MTPTADPVEAQLRALVESVVAEHPPAGVGFLGADVFAYLRDGLAQEGKEYPEYLLYEIFLLGRPITYPLAPAWMELSKQVEAAVGARRPPGPFGTKVSVGEPDEFTSYRILTEAAFATRDLLGSSIPFTRINVPFTRRHAERTDTQYVWMTCAVDADVPDPERVRQIEETIRKLALERGFAPDLAAKIHLGYDSQSADEWRRNNGWYS